MYFGKDAARIRVGRVEPGIKTEWLAAIIHEETGEHTEIIQASKIQQTNCCGFGVDLFLYIKEDGM